MDGIRRSKKERHRDRQKVRGKISVTPDAPVSGVAYFHFEQSLPWIGLRRNNINTLIIILFW